MPETANQIFGHIISGVAGGLIVALVQSFLSRSNSRVLKREADISADKLEFIPLIDSYIERAGRDATPNRVFRDCIRDLQDRKRRFCLHLEGRKLQAFNKAWSILEQTSEQEMIRKDGQGVFTPDQADEFEQVSKILISRLEAFRHAVKDT